MARNPTPAIQPQQRRTPWPEPRHRLNQPIRGRGAAPTRSPTSSQLRAHASTAGAFETINDGTLKISINYADLATSDRLAAQLLDADAAGELTLATRPKAAALVKLPRRLDAR